MSTQETAAKTETRSDVSYLFFVNNSLQKNEGKVIFSFFHVRCRHFLIKIAVLRYRLLFKISYMFLNKGHVSCELYPRDEFRHISYLCHIKMIEVNSTHCHTSSQFHRKIFKVIG